MSSRSKAWLVAATIGAVEASKDQLGLCRWNYMIRSVNQRIRNNVRSATQANRFSSSSTTVVASCKDGDKAKEAEESLRTHLLPRGLITRILYNGDSLAYACTVEPRREYSCLPTLPKKISQQSEETPEQEHPTLAETSFVEGIDRRYDPDVDRHQMDRYEPVMERQATKGGVSIEKKVKSRKPFIPKHLRREVNKVELDGFHKKVKRVPKDMSFEDAYYKYRLVSIMAIDTADLLGLKMEPSQDSFNFVDNSRENSAGMIKNVKVEIGDCTIPVDFHAVNFKSGKTPPLLFGRAFMATVGAVCDLKKNKMCLTNVDETVFYDPVEKKKNSTQESTDESSSYPTSDVDIDITMEDFLELEEFLDLEDGEQFNDLDSDREVTMEYFLELEEWLDSDQKLDNEQNLTRDLKTLLKASIDRHQPNDIDRYPTSTINRYPTSTIDRYQPNIVARHPPNCIDRHSCLDELPGYTVEMEPIKERMHKYEISHLDFVVPCVVFEVEFPIPPDRDGVRKSRVRSRCFSQPFAKLKALLIAEMIDKEEESMEEAFTQE
ncbi:hypothetical protein F2Q69_00047885 [Brassica cretica]|uniref:Uncharacterized protein n=1 Tax=Brassica cretica TaxID=69181 RepID=A0A8S9PZQ2_BRACR|nr:hypothetical protein F2Q69_00047885 [Brassica cretica]